MNFEQLKGKKIALLLSGGVDSAVVLHVLTENGIMPDCFYIKIGPEEQEELGEKLCVRCLTASRACCGELKQRCTELTSLDGIRIEDVSLVTQ